MSSQASCVVTGAAIGVLAVTEVTVAAKTGAAIGFIGGPAGAVAGAAVGAVAGAAIFGVASLFRSGGGGGSSNHSPPSPLRPRVVRQASITHQLQQGTSGQAGGSGQDPDWWNNINRNEECLSPLEIFQRIVQEILKRLKGASRSERLALLKKLREALADLLKRYPKIKIEIEPGTGNLVLDLPDEAIELKPDLIEALGVFNEVDLDLGIGRDVNQPCVYRIRCRDCGTNYVGQSVSPRERVRNHRKDMKAKDTTKSLYQHHKSHRCVYGCDCNFEDSYDFVIVMLLEEGSTYPNLRPAEVFWQWLMKALEDVDGIGKR